METEMETEASVLIGMTETTAVNVETEIMIIAAIETLSPEARVREETELTVTTELAEEATDKAVRMDAVVHPVREEAMTDRLYPRWRQNLTRKIPKNAIITIRKEINSRNWIKAVRVRKTKTECSSVLLKNSLSQRNITNRNRRLWRKKKIFWKDFQQERLRSQLRSR